MFAVSNRNEFWWQSSLCILTMKAMCVSKGIVDQLSKMPKILSGNAFNDATIYSKKKTSSILLGASLSFMTLNHHRLKRVILHVINCHLNCHSFFKCSSNLNSSFDVISNRNIPFSCNTATISKYSWKRELESTHVHNYIYKQKMKKKKNPKKTPK